MKDERAQMQHEDKGLAYDLSLILAHDRRKVLKWISAGVVVPLVGCSDDGKGGDSAGTDDSGGTDDSAITDDSTVIDDSGVETCSRIPEETAGPFPGDGTNGADALEISGIVRSDVRTSIGSGVGTAEGVELTIEITVVDVDGCTPLEGYAVYIWQCDRESKYSMYTAPKATYLRGVQVSDANGKLTFTTIFPGCYPGRWPHIHFEVYQSLAAIADAKKVVATSQMAFSEAVCSEVYKASGYEASIDNLAGVSLATDSVFRDDLAVNQIPSLTGNVEDGYAGTFTIGI